MRTHSNHPLLLTHSLRIRIFRIETANSDLGREREEIRPKNTNDLARNYQDETYRTSYSLIGPAVQILDVISKLFL